ncbi:DUF7146 domain-containing protein [Hyphococcus luteus]|uniref:DNA primase n=1 Tax=Hyphococcus luteus TaxID=2058213 RepID=A0A2S7K9R2_9PROT|nr:toprim domain-containing protein [Marinicaulis flavus]PQA89246.1 DNA primase [Marinicaulis flavus]
MSRAKEIAARLAGRAEETARAYLSNGRRCGAYWIAGDVRNARGKSLWVCLSGPPGAVGRWRDEAEAGAHGDLLDLIRMARGFDTIAEAMIEAERFLGMPARLTSGDDAGAALQGDRIAAARRLYECSHPVTGTPGEAYLKARGLASPVPDAIRFHPNAMYRDEHGARHSGPALIAAITDHAGALQGVHRSWIDMRGREPIVLRRRILGKARGHGVFLGGRGRNALAGEGLETVLSICGMIEGVRCYAALSAVKLASWTWPADASGIFIAVDRDRHGAGEQAARRLAARAHAHGTAARLLFPRLGDFNDDLRIVGAAALASALAKSMR